jgi:FkbM family methyltransferase
MAEFNSPIRNFIKPFLFKFFGKRGYFLLQYFAKLKDIKEKLVEESEMRLLPRLIKKNDEVLDIGANYAYFTVRLAGICPSGKVYAFEPIPFTYNVAHKIVKHYKLSNVNLYNKGVSNKNETIVFEVPVQSFGAISAGQAHISGRDNTLPGNDRLYKFSSHEKVKCEVVTIDSFLPQLKNLTFIKMDIEGAEYFALKGMVGTLTKFKPVILMEVIPFFFKGFNIAESQIISFFEEMNYEFYAYNNSENKIEPCPPPFSERNYIMIHKEKIAEYKNLM